jgi:hypothetical protein
MVVAANSSNSRAAPANGDGGQGAALHRVGAMPAAREADQRAQRDQGEDHVGCDREAVGQSLVVGDQEGVVRAGAAAVAGGIREHEGGHVQGPGGKVGGSGGEPVDAALKAPGGEHQQQVHGDRDEQLAADRADREQHLRVRERQVRDHQV